MCTHHNKVARSLAVIMTNLNFTDLALHQVMTQDYVV